jgi:hypothetical protein
MKATRETRREVDVAMGEGRGTMHRSPHVRRRARAATLLLLAALIAIGAAAGLAGCGAGSGAGANTAATATADAAIATATRQRLDALAPPAAADFTGQVQTTYDATQRTAQVEATVGWTADITGMDIAKEQERAKSICFQVQRAIWAAGVAVRQVTVIVLGPVSTGYGEQITEAHAAARLTAGTAAGFSWAALTPDAAWGRYDEVYLRSDYDPPVV